MRRNRTNNVWRITNNVIIAAAWLLLASAPCSIAAADEPCEPAWDNAIGQPGFDDGSVMAMTVYDGELVAAGWFTTSGGKTLSNIARWDGVGWHPFKSPGGHTGLPGGNYSVRAASVYNGDLIAGGWFPTAGGKTVNNVARWDGQAWHPLTSGGQVGTSVGWILALTSYNGNLIAGGSFMTAGGQTMNGIARWDGSAWHPLASAGQSGVGGNSTNSVEALTLYNGDLVAGGWFTTAGGQTVNNIARWDGSAWQPFTSGDQIGVNSSVRALTVWNGDLIAGGNFSTAGGETVNRIARWDGSAWHPFTSGGQIGVPLSFFGFALTVWNGDLIAGGSFTTAGGQTVNKIARWDGNAWHQLASGGQVGLDGGDVRSLAVFDGDLVAAGDFFAAGGQDSYHIATWGNCDAPPCIPTDLNCDGVVGVADLLLLLSQWGTCANCAPGACPADLDGNCTVGVADLLILLANWG